MPKNSRKWQSVLLLWGVRQFQMKLPLVYFTWLAAKEPFVMNTEKQVKQAFKDFREGKFGDWPEKPTTKKLVK